MHPDDLRTIRHGSAVGGTAEDLSEMCIRDSCKMERFDALKRAMFDIGITGMTAINVMGCGEQRGKTEGYFRGARVEATMLPSIQVSIVVCRLPVRLVVETAKKVLYTGHIGDGKIFIYDVENVIKVRTGEEGYGALQDAE